MEINSVEEALRVASSLNSIFKGTTLGTNAQVLALTEWVLFTFRSIEVGQGSGSGSSSTSHSVPLESPSSSLFGKWSNGGCVIEILSIDYSKTDELEVRIDGVGPIRMPLTHFESWRMLTKATKEVEK